MKNFTLNTILSTIFLALVNLSSISTSNAQVNASVSLDLFYDELSPYGHWDIDADYGDIWYPNEDRNFQPYSSNGYWTMTEYGNTWVSNYNWGWAPFHYGRWVFNNHRGWGWIPGYEWGPAWVEWRSGNGYYGWAPMMPRHGINISINIPVSAWIFSPVRHIYSTNFHQYAHYGRTNIYNRTTIINNTYIVNNNRYYGGPSRRDIERNLGRRVTVRNIRHTNTPGASRVDRRNVSIYRPENNTRNTSRNSSDRNVSSRESKGRNEISNRTPRREMHIDNKGNVTMKDRNTPSVERNTTKRNNTNNNNTADRNSRISERNNTTNRQVGNTSRNNNTFERRETTVPKTENNGNRSSRRAERTPQVREQRPTENTSRRSNTVFQTSNSNTRENRSNSSSSPRIDRSSHTNNNRSTSREQRNNNSVSERGRR